MRLFLTSLLTLALSCMMFINNAALASEVDLDAGETVFSANCVACHAGGENLVNPIKTLKMEDLEKFEMNSINAITTQVTNGKNSMPSFKGVLEPEDIVNVANYVLNQSENGW
uniref:Cytochrome c6 n=1 Tax=Crouania attenuata TaxID=42002 RepID=A0A4D6WPE9_9FLOR|nr:cytochrome c553 [Crouania attenuata]